MSVKLFSNVIGGVSEGLSGNIVTDNDQNMENWNNTGNADVEYVDDENSITYENSDSGYIDKDFTVENGELYYVSFDYYNYTGFNSGSTDNVIVKSGINTRSITLNYVSGFYTYSCILPAGSETLNIKIDLSGIISSGDIDIRFSNFRIFKLC